MVYSRLTWNLIHLRPFFHIVYFWSTPGGTWEAKNLGSTCGKSLRATEQILVVTESSKHDKTNTVNANFHSSFSPAISICLDRSPAFLLLLDAHYHWGHNISLILRTSAAVQTQESCPKWPRLQKEDVWLHSDARWVCLGVGRWVTRG